MARGIYFIVLFSSFITLAFAIKCWTCRSDSDPKCGDPFDNTTLPITDCDVVELKHLHDSKTSKPMKATMCRKIRQKIHGSWRVLRECAFIGSPGEGTGNEHHCHIVQGTYDVYMESCLCNSKDGCNSSVSMLARNHVNCLLSVPIIMVIVKIFTNC